MLGLSQASVQCQVRLVCHDEGIRVLSGRNTVAYEKDDARYVRYVQGFAIGKTKERRPRISPVFRSLDLF